MTCISSFLEKQYCPLCANKRHRPFHFFLRCRVDSKVGMKGRRSCPMQTARLRRNQKKWKMGSSLESYLFSVSSYAEMVSWIVKSSLWIPAKSGLRRVQHPRLLQFWFWSMLMNFRELKPPLPQSPSAPRMVHEAMPDCKCCANFPLW